MTKFKEKKTFLDQFIRSFIHLVIIVTKDVVNYFVSFQINVLVDTGSSNFAIASRPHPYLPLHFQPER